MALGLAKKGAFTIVKDGERPGLLGGVEVQLGDAKFVIPPLNIEALELHSDDIVAAQTDRTLKIKDKMALLTRVIHTAIKRNYKNMTLKELRQRLDLGNIVPTFHAVMNVAGFEEVAETAGETPRAG